MSKQSLDEPPLEEDVIKALKRHSEHGAWTPATMIGLEVGFDRQDAARRVNGVLKDLVRRGLVEEERSKKPIIYRWARWEPFFDVIAQNIKTGEKRFLDKGKTEGNAEAIVRFAVIRRGVDEEFYYTAPAGTVEADSKDYDHANK